MGRSAVLASISTTAPDTRTPSTVDPGQMREQSPNNIAIGTSRS
jgi:hypothetical protein